jgi:hypothetical protein
MKAAVGDALTVKGRHQGDEDRHGEIIEIHGEAGSPPYLVQWQDGHESVFFPSADTIIAAGSSGASRARGRHPAGKVPAQPSRASRSARRRQTTK